MKKSDSSLIKLLRPKQLLRVINICGIERHFCVHFYNCKMSNKANIHRIRGSLNGQILILLCLLLRLLQIFKCTQDYFIMAANTMNHNQTAPTGAVWSWSILFVIKPVKVHEQMRRQTIVVVNGGKMVNLLLHCTMKYLNVDKRV